jgi:hypothetical protein
MSQYHVPMTAGCKICCTKHPQALQRAQSVVACLNVMSMSIVQKLMNWMCINAIGLHLMQLTYAIDGYDWCLQGQLLSMVYHAWKCSHPDNSDNNLCQKIQHMGLMIDGACNIMLRYGDGISFGCFLVSLFFSSLIWITGQSKRSQHGSVPPATVGGDSQFIRSANRTLVSIINQ